MDQPEKNLKNKSQKIRFICDFSPPKGSDPNLIKQAEQLSTDYISIAYNPGKSVGANSAFTAYLIKKKFKKKRHIYFSYPGYEYTCYTKLFSRCKFTRP